METEIVAMRPLSAAQTRNKFMVLGAFEYGSSAKGYANKYSDIDVMFVYAYGPLAYYGISPLETSIKFSDGNTEYSGMEVRSFFRSLHKSNVEFMAMLGAGYNRIYQLPWFVRKTQLAALPVQNPTKSLWHHYHICKGYSVDQYGDVQLKAKRLAKCAYHFLCMAWTEYWIKQPQAATRIRNNSTMFRERLADQAEALIHPSSAKDLIIGLREAYGNDQITNDCARAIYSRTTYHNPVNLEDPVSLYDPEFAKEFLRNVSFLLELKKSEYEDIKTTISQAALDEAEDELNSIAAMYIQTAWQRS